MILKVACYHHAQAIYPRFALRLRLKNKFRFFFGWPLSSLYYTECLNKNVTLTKRSESIIILAFSLNITYETEEQGLMINLVPTDLISLHGWLRKTYFTKWCEIWFAPTVDERQEGQRKGIPLKSTSFTVQVTLNWLLHTVMRAGHLEFGYCRGGTGAEIF